MRNALLQSAFFGTATEGPPFRSPGTVVPSRVPLPGGGVIATEKRFEFAPQDRLAHVDQLALRFFAELVGLGYSECLVTDELDLWDFACTVSEDRGVEVAAMLDRMDQHYFVDSQCIESTRIVDLLEHLARLGVTN